MVKNAEIFARAHINSLSRMAIQSFLCNFVETSLMK